jgi:hypothetical protein
LSRLVVEEAVRMSRRNTRQGKAQRRAERDRWQVTERKRKPLRTSDQGPRTVEDQAIQAARRPEGSDPRNSDEHGSELRADADADPKGLTATDLDEADLETDADLENVDLGDFGDLDADDADLQAALTVLARKY